MKLPLYQVDAFTSKLFHGNPAAVCPLESWLDEELMQSIAAENNLSETAFLVPDGDRFQLRWFTPKAEVDLCGHATLASAFVLMTQIDPARNQVVFDTKSGELEVRRNNDLYTLDFPSRPPAPCIAPPTLADALGASPQEVWAAKVYMAVFESAQEVIALEPDMKLLAELDKYAVIATGPGEDCDFVSRFFAPQVGVPEDPVTGSAHCTLIPYWSDCLGKQQLIAQQVSERGGELYCDDLGDRVTMSGRAVLYSTGTIHL
ncbi:MAG TPA: PhzF family phenazine biosynthesis protein [Bryobacteraceae bacterium]|nr:PhzF family phenazine biosynthesis protein [Bryobacteraceae bacterium]